MTRWRDRPIAPSDYEDIVGLVKAARVARSSIVEFDWTLSREDLECLRRAVFEWGRTGVGSFKCFDARVLAAINRALDEPNSAYFLNEPRRMQGMDCSVDCERSQDGFRLRGFGPFAVVCGYGRAANDHAALGNARLGSNVKAVLTEAIESLGWNVRRLVQDERLRPAVNTLYGLPLSYGVDARQMDSRTPTDLSVHFQGPFSAIESGDCRCLFTSEMARQTGVYIWTIEIGAKHHPWYVGQTRRGFGQRTGEHLAGFMSGQYPIPDITKLVAGQHALAPGVPQGRWPDTLPTLLQNHEAVWPHMVGVIQMLRFHLAPIEGDARLYDRVEGAVGRCCRDNQDAVLNGFFAPGIKLPARIPFDSPLRLIISSDIPIEGLLSELMD